MERRAPSSGPAPGAAAVAVGLTLTPQLLVLGPPALVIAGLLALRMLPDRREAPAGGLPAAPKQRRLSGPMLLLGAIALASMLCEGAAADWSSVYLRDSLDGGTEVAGFGFAAFTLAMVMVRVAGNRLLARFAVHRALPALAGLATVTFAAALAVRSVPLSVVGFFLLGLGLGTVVPSVFSAAGRLPGMHAGVAVTVVSSLGWVGFVAGPPLIGQLAGLTSLSVALVVVPILTAFITIACARVRALRDPDVSTHEVLA